MCSSSNTKLTATIAHQQRRNGIASLLQDAPCTILFLSGGEGWGLGALYRVAPVELVASRCIVGILLSVKFLLYVCIWYKLFSLFLLGIGQKLNVFSFCFFLLRGIYTHTHSYIRTQHLVSACVQFYNFRFRLNEICKRREKKTESSTTEAAAKITKKN